MKDALKANDRIELRGFGVFFVKPRKRSIGRNPRTGSEVNIPPGKAVRFKPGKDLQSLYGLGVRPLPFKKGRGAERTNGSVQPQCNTAHGTALGARSTSVISCRVNTRRETASRC